MRKLLTIGEVAKLLHLTTSQIRFYERKGLISPHKVEENGYRLYSFKEIDTLEYIVTFRQIGLSISEIKEIMSQKKGYNLTDLLDNTMEQLRNEMEEMKKRLSILEQLKEASVSHLDEEPKIFMYPERTIFVLDEDHSLERSEKELFDLVETFGLDYRFNDQQFLSILNHEKMMMGIQSKEDTQPLKELPTYTLKEGTYFTWNITVNTYGEFDKAFQRLLERCRKEGHEPEGEAIAVEDVATFLSAHNQIRLTVQTRIKKRS